MDGAENWGLARDSAGRLVMGGRDLTTLAREHGTPLHVVDVPRLRTTYRGFRDAFTARYPRTRLSYSYKSNCIPGVLRVLHAEGCGAEVISPYELWLAGRLGVPPRNIIYNGVNKSAEDLRAAARLGVGHLNVDSMAEIERVRAVADEMDRPLDIGIRVSPSVGWRAHFGVDPHRDRLVEACRRLRAEERVRVRGLHAHFGSALRATGDYARATRRLCELMRDIHRSAGVTIETLDLGGGFGVPTVKQLTVGEVGRYRLLGMPPRAPKAADCPRPEGFADAITGAIGDACRRDGLPTPELLLEPGRAITSAAQLLLLTVKEVKRRHAGLVALVDGGMQNIAFPLSYEYHACLLASRAGDGHPHRRYTVVGPLCSPEDVLYRNWTLPSLAEGDLLAIMDAGAYFTSFANNFSFPRPPVALVEGGASTLVRRRETFEHMTALDDA